MAISASVHGLVPFCLWANRLHVKLPTSWILPTTLTLNRDPYGLTVDE